MVIIKMSHKIPTHLKFKCQGPLLLKSTSISNVKIQPVFWAGFKVACKLKDWVPLNTIAKDLAMYVAFSSND